MKIIDKITITVICITIIIASIIVGTPLKENTKVITAIVLAIFAMYIVTKIIATITKITRMAKQENKQEGKQKNKRIGLNAIIWSNIKTAVCNNINKLDICVFILCLCPFIPIIFKTEANMQDAINIGTRYLTIFMIYIITKMLIKENKTYQKYIVATIIFAGVISAIIGIDNMTYKNFLEPLNKIGVPFIVNIESRMFGNFGYANTFAMSMLIALILSLDKYTQDEYSEEDKCLEKKNLKLGNFANKFPKGLIYAGVDFIFIACILLSYSKAVYIIMAVAILMYCILQKNKAKNMKALAHVIIAGICGVIYTKIFANMYQEKNNLGTWLVLIGFMCIEIVATMLANKMIKYEKIDIKKCIIFVICIICLAVVFVVLGLNLDTPLVMFQKETQRGQVKYKISNIEPNTEYEFKFDIEAKTLNNKKVYYIQVIEEDEHLQTIIEHKIRINTFTGEKVIEFETSEDTREIALVFNSNSYTEQQGLTINNFEINGEKYVLNYLYLPASIVNKIKNFSLGSLSVTERLTFYKDGLKLIEQNPWTGIGGNGWVYKYKEVASYDYGATQVHSYPLQIFLEFGILAIITFLAIVFVLLKNLKNCNAGLYGIFTATFAILLHCLVDFDLSFFNMLLYTFLLIAVISGNYSKRQKNY